MTEAELLESAEGEGVFRLLLADDDEGIRKVIRSVCHKHDLGVEVIEAGDGEEAWDAFTRFSPDMVITDVRMPRLDGIELLRRIRRVSKDVEVIVITGFSETPMIVAALKAGASNFIEKPFEIGVISGEISRSVGRARTILSARKLEGELKEERRLRESSSHLATAGRLVAGLAADIRNPLTYLKGNAELIGDLLSRLPEEVREGEEMLEARALLADIGAGARAIEEKLSLMRRFQGATAMGVERLMPLRKLLADAAILARGRRPANVNFKIELPDERICVKVHPLEMESCLVNLIVNGFEALEGDGGIVEVSTESLVSDTDGGWMRITVSTRREDRAAPGARKPEDAGEKSSFWLWVAAKAAENNGAELLMSSDEQGTTTASLGIGWMYETGGGKGKWAD